MKAKPILIALAIFILVLVAFFLGQRTQIPKKKGQVKKVAESSTAKKNAAAVATVVKSPRVIKIAIVIDDFGYTINNLPAFFDINEPLTFSILPNVRHSRDVAIAAKEHGHEIILHMPMAAHRKDVKEEVDTLKPGDSKKSVEAKLAKAIESVPGLKGLSNHMGSKATEDKELMSEVLTYLKKRNLYFFDSLTSNKSVCREVAESVRIPFAKRDIFLDNSNKIDSIEMELANLEKLAIKRGRDVVGVANTGTGKTAAFLIPLINKVLKDRNQKILIMVPTRELATQIDDELLHTIGDMFRTMYAAPGIGLAANQVGLSRNFAVIDLQPGGQKHPMVIINPVIEERSGTICEEEGCLSVPGFSARVKRAAKVRVRALNEHGLPVVIEGEGLLARCLQHEIDHLNGKLYVDRLPLVSRLRIKRDIDRRRKQGLF